MVTVPVVALLVVTNVGGKAASGTPDKVASASATPVPLRVTVALPALVVPMASDAVRAPAAPGAKVTVTVQLALLAKLVVAVQDPPSV